MVHFYEFCHLILIHFKGALPPALPRERELQAQAEVLRGCRITARRQQWSVGLPVVIEAHGEQSRQCVVGRERQLECGVAAACRACHCGNVAAYRCLLTEAQVEAQAQVVVHAID